MQSRLLIAGGATTRSIYSVRGISGRVWRRNSRRQGSGEFFLGGGEEREMKDQQLDEPIFSSEGENYLV